MMDATAIKEIRSGVTSEVVSLQGVDFYKNNDSLKAVTFPSPDCLKVFSLTQVVSAIKDNEFSAEKGVVVNVLNHKKVEVFSRKRDLNKKLVNLVTADFAGIFKEFENDEKFSQEEFIIRLQSRFARTPEMVDLLSLVSKVSDDKTSDTSDNGYAQVATMKAGVHLVSEAVVKPVWVLNPFKSFPEITPVPVSYVLRIHSSHRDNGPQFALYEADGGRWKVDSTIAVKDWLEKALAGIDHVTVL